MPVNYRDVAYITIHIFTLGTECRDVLKEGTDEETLALKEKILKGECGEPHVILNKWDPFLLWPSSCILVFLSMAHRQLVGQKLPIIEDLLSHSHKPQSVGILWTSDRPVAQTSTCQQTTITRDGHPCPRRDSKPKSQ
jgi:hypothetical protein